MNTQEQDLRNDASNTGAQGIFNNSTININTTDKDRSADPEAGLSKEEEIVKNIQSKRSYVLDLYDGVFEDNKFLGTLIGTGFLIASTKDASYILTHAQVIRHVENDIYAAKNKNWKCVIRYQKIDADFVLMQTNRIARRIPCELKSTEQDNQTVVVGAWVAEFEQKHVFRGVLKQNQTALNREENTTQWEFKLDPTPTSLNYRKKLLSISGSPVIDLKDKRVIGIFHSNQDLQAGLVCSVRSIIAVLSETIGQSLIVKNEPVEDQSVNQLAVAVYNDHYRPRVEKLQDNPDNQTSLIAQLNQLGEIYSGLRDIAQNPGNAPATRLITLVNDYIIKYLKRNMDRFDVASVYAFRLGLMAQTIVATAKELDVEVDVSKAVKRGIDNLVKDAE